MKKKEFYKYRIKEGASKKMSSILKDFNSRVAIVDGAMCSITAVIPANNYFIKDGNLDVENLYQIKILNSKSNQEALVTPELLENIPEAEWIIIDLDVEA
ncbi:MAG: hypothetical protein RLZZ540_1247 [Bacteroidota bacterium]